MAHEVEMEIFSSGTWNGDSYTEADLATLADNFAKFQGELKPVLKLGHRADDPKGQPALGIIDRLFVKGRKLIASIKDIPPVIMQAIQKGLYRAVSAELYPDYKGQGFALKAVALLGADVPAVNTLKDLQAYFDAEQTALLPETELLRFEMVAPQIQKFEKGANDMGNAISHEQSKQLDRAAQARIERAKGFGRVITYSEAMRDELREHPENFRAYTETAPAEPRGKFQELSGLQQKQLSTRYARLFENLESTVKQGKFEQDNMYRARLHQRMVEDHPFVARCYLKNNSIDSNDIAELRRMGVFKD